jgi:hypothetical protein
MLHVLRVAPRPVPDQVLQAMFAARKTCLRHAPAPLAASGLDINAGHPAAMLAGLFTQARFSRLGVAFGDAWTD